MGQGEGARTLVAGPLGALVAFVLGVLAGLTLPDLWLPNSSDVHAAARSLVPPGSVIDGETAGTEGPNPFFPYYQVHLRLTGGAAGEAERLDALDRQAQARGWAKKDDSTYGTYAYEYTRGFMTGVVDVRASGVEVIAGLPDSWRLWFTIAASRAGFPLAGVLIWWVVRWRLQRRV